MPSGSSPLARGTLRELAGTAAGKGLIPARAGNTRTHLTAAASAMGSSPLARGTLNNTLVPAVKTGLIPARAGNTEVLVAADLHDGAHPRSRGEHVTFWGFLSVCLGSSPLARGTRQRRAQRIHLRGLIPARAGNTEFEHSLKDKKRAHPRSRGEHVDDLAFIVIMPGSSPLARGTPRPGN